MNEITKVGDLLPDLVKEQSLLLERAKLDSPLLRRNLSPFQIKTFLVGREFSRFGQYKAALVEAESRIESLEKLYLERERTKIELEKLDEVYQTDGKSARDKRSIRLDIIEQEISLRNQSQKIESLEVEVGTLFEIIESFSEEEKNISEVEYWETKLRREVGLNMALGQPLSMNLVESCLNMPEGCEIRDWLEGQIQERSGQEGSDGK